MNVIKEIIKEQQTRALSNWGGFMDPPTSKADAQAAIKSISKKFQYRAKGVPQPKPILKKGVATEVSDTMGLLSGSEAKQLANYIKRYFFRNIVYVR